MKITLDISPEEFKQLIGADKVEQMWMDQVKGQLDIANGNITFPMNLYSKDLSEQWPKSVEEYWRQFATWMNREDGDEPHSN